MLRRTAPAAMLVIVLIAALLAAAVGPWTALPAAAAQDDRLGTIVADAVDDDVYVEQAPVVSPARLADLAARIAATDQRWAFVVLDAEPDNAKVLARDVLADLRSATGEHSTVVVLTPTSLAAESVVEDYRSRLDGALTDALPAINRGPVTGIASVFEALSGARLADASPAAEDEPGGDGNGSPVVPVAIVAAALAAGAAVALTVARRR